MADRIVSADDARKNFAELLNIANFGNERIQIRRRGKVAGYLIGAKDMARLESLDGTSEHGTALAPEREDSQRLDPTHGYSSVISTPRATPAPSTQPEAETVSWDELQEEF